MCAATASNSSAFLSPQATTLAGQSLGLADEVGHRLRDPVLGNELLHIEIDRRRSDARAILSRRDHPLRETRRGLAAAVGATIDHRLMFGDFQSRLGHIEHLPLLNPRDHRCRQSGQAMATRLRFVPFDDVGLCDLLQPIAGMSRLPAARLARLAARAAGDARRPLQAVARWRLAAVRAVLVQLTPQVRDLMAQRRVLKPAKPQSRAPAGRSGRQSRVAESSIPRLMFPHPSRKIARPQSFSTKLLLIRLTHLGSYVGVELWRKSLKNKESEFGFRSAGFWNLFPPAWISFRNTGVSFRELGNTSSH